jgi:hypothetical protein
LSRGTQNPIASPKQFVQTILSFRPVKKKETTPTASTEEEEPEDSSSLQDAINKLKEICIDETDYMNEEDYVNCDKNLKGTGILSFEEIAAMVKNEEFFTNRSHKRKVKDAKPGLK